jgi:CRP/FNR family transcriptional regulator
MSLKIKTIDCKDCKSFKTSIFCDLKPDLLKDINVTKLGTSFKKGQVIFEEGGRPNGIHCITSGKVKIYKFGIDKDQIVRVANSSDIIGYRSLISNELYSATAQALEETHTCFIPKNVFFDLIDKDKSFTLKLMRILSNNLKTAESQTMNIAQKTVKERLAEFLILKHKALTNQKDNIKSSFSFSRKDSSDILGCAPETLTRMLSQFNTDKLIGIEKKKIKILDFQKLKRIANIYD